MSSPSTPKAHSFASSPPSIATSLPPFSTTSIARLQSLYSDFSRQKQSNPTSYHANIEWWRKALEALVSSGKQDDQSHLKFNEGAENIIGKSDRLVLHAGRELIERLKIPKVGKPLALGAVLSELQGPPRSLFPLPLFIDTKRSVYDPGWLPTRIAKVLVGKPLWWALEHMGIVGDEGILGSLTSTGPSGGARGRERDMSWWGEYVILSLVEKAADEVVERHEQRGKGSRADSLYGFNEFRKVFGGLASGKEGEVLREIDTAVLLKFLERDRKIIVVDQEVIKFIDQVTPLEERVVTPVDRGILELKTAVSNLHAQVDSLHKKIDEYTRKATTALLAKRKRDALGYLKSRKLLEDVLNKRLVSLHTLESTFIAVETAAGDVEIMESYKSSTAALRAILAHPSLQRSRIDETMEALAEANMDAREVDEAIRVGMDVAIGTEGTVDEAELEEEWKAIVKENETEEEQEKEEEKRKKLEELGATPKEVIQEGEPAKDVAVLSI